MRILIPITAILLAISRLCAATPVRIAIINGTQEAPLEALLVTALSKTEGIELVERTEINRLVDEKQLSDLEGSGKFTGLGSLIHADGLLVIESISIPEKPPVITVRLISVRTGACMMAALPPEKSGADSNPVSQEWAAWVAGDVARRGPKLLVTRENAIPVSVLNIRAALLNAENSRLESSVTKLLESRLAAAANVILLDRRQLGDIQFERGLDAADMPPLADVAVVVDGSFLVGGQGDPPMEVSLRLRQKNGTPLASSTVRGKPSDVPALAGSIAAAVLKALKQPPQDGAWDRPREAAEYFDEAVWERRSGAYPAARDAIAAARALGDRTPDIAALDAWVVCGEARPSALEGTQPPRSEQYQDFLTGFASLREFEASDAKVTRFRFDAETYLHTDLVEAASVFLRRNDESAQPIDAEPLREMVRQAAGIGLEKNPAPEGSGAIAENSTPTAPERDPLTALYDRLAGSAREIVREVRAAGSEQARKQPGLGVVAKYCPMWARNSDELIDLYVKLLEMPLDTDIRQTPFRRYQGELLKGLPQSPAEALGPRFRNDPKAMQAWETRLDRMCAKPHARLRALLVRAGTAETPSQAADYREFLLELARQGPALETENELGQYLDAIAFRTDAIDGHFPEDRKKGQMWTGWTFHSRFPREHTELLLTLCKTLPRFEPRLSSPASDLKMPNDLRQETWDAYRAYQDRCVQRGADSRAIVDFSRITSSLLAANPGFLPAPAAPGAGLLVRRFWDPYHLPSWQGDFLRLREMVVFDGQVWIDAQDYASRETGQIFTVTPADFQTSLLQFAGGNYNSDMVLAPDAIWRISEKEKGYSVTRHDRKTGADQSWPAPCGGRLSVVNGRVFVAFELTGTGAALEELDTKSGEWQLLVSTRRNPPQSPPDQWPYLQPLGVIAGPGGKLLFATGNRDGGLYELGGAWKKCNPFPSPSLIQFDCLSLMYERHGRAILIDPKKPDPESWSAGVGSPDGDQAKARWKFSQLPFTLQQAGLVTVAFRPNEMFVLEQDQKGAHKLHWWFEGSPREGVIIPLTFQFPAAEKELLASMVAKITNPARAKEFGFANVVDPNTNAALLRIYAVRDGLILTNRIHGFWFIPNDDLRAMIAKSDKVPTVTKSDSKNP